jgi:F-type H+-transporting ATPase subunit epsilon
MKVAVITPEKVLAETEADFVAVPTSAGPLGIRGWHIPLVAPLKEGEVVLKKDSGGSQVFAVYGGFLEVTADSVTILADSALSEDSLNEKEIEAAVARAKALQESTTDQYHLAELSASIQANLSYLKITQRKKARGKVHL